MPAPAYLVLTNVTPTKWLGTLSESRQTIGRGEEAHLRLPGEYVHVSRQHAVVWSDDAGHWITDLGSTSGTRVNGVPLAPYQPFRLSLGDHLWIGGAELDLVASPDLARRPAHERGDSTVSYNAGQTAALEFPDAPADLFATLTPAELDVVLCISRGLTDPSDIATALARSPHTVRSHLTNIYGKLNVHSRDQLLACLVRRHSDAPAPQIIASDQ